MTSRKIPEINAGSMADIAFLLLVFFLVTTTIQTDAGVPTTLPAWNPIITETPIQVNYRNVYAIQINANDQLLIRDKQGTSTQIRTEIKAFITNFGKNPDLSETPQRAIVSLYNDNGTSYNKYVEVYNEIKAAYNEVWDDYAKSKFGYHYEDLSRTQKKEVRNVFPMVISEAEPTNFAKQ